MQEAKGKEEVSFVLWLGWSLQAGRLQSGGGGCNTCRAARSATSTESPMCWT